LLLNGGAAAFGQPPAINIAGIWQFTAGTLSFQIQINQTGTKIVGYYGGTAAFSGIISATTPGTHLDIYWYLPSKVPGVPDGAAYVGDIAGDSMQGEYEIEFARILGTWSAKKLSGLGPAITGISNAADGMSGQIAPGELISIYASAATNPIGPATGVGLQLDQSGKISTTLGGVQVHFLPIDVYAPVTYASAGQINAIVPYEVAGLTNASVQVQYINQTSKSFDVQIVTTAPAIFTANGTGAGQGAILNHDGKLNGPNTPEPRGGVVVLFITGEGQISPPGVSGKITTLSSTPPLTPTPMAAVSVLINGQAAFVAFHGEAPGLVSGVMQLNVQVPTTISSGNVPIQVSVGGKSTPNVVTVSVR
jgi:uncharacterized protein (TIGR03437 family)